MKNAELHIVASKTYASAANARKAVEKSGYAHIKHIIACNEAGRWFPAFIPTEDEMCSTGVHWHWNVIAIRRSPNN